MGRGSNGRSFGGVERFREVPRGFGQRERESPRDDYPRLSTGGSAGSLSSSRSEETLPRTALPTRFDKEFVRAAPL